MKSTHVVVEPVQAWSHDRIPALSIDRRVVAACLLLLLPLMMQSARATEASPEAKGIAAREIALPAMPGASLDAPAVRSESAMRAAPNGFDVGGVIETVRHHFGASDARHGGLEATDRLYRVVLLPTGIELSLRKSAPELERGGHSGPSGRPSLRAEAIPFEDAPGFRLAVTGLSSAQSPLAWDPGEWQGQFNRAERSIARGVVERVTAREGGAEWEFVLERPVSGAADFAIRAGIDASGPPVRALPSSEAGQSGSGGEAWRWPMAWGRSLTMGEMVVKDAGGRVIYRALPEASAGEVRLIVPARVLSAARFPVTIDPLISVEYPASDPISALPALGSQNSPAVAWDGKEYLIVWNDNRSATSEDVFGARVSAAGTVLDPAGIVITEAADDQQSPSVAWSGTSFLVVWQDRRSGSNWDIWGARVSTAGAVLDPAGLFIAGDRGDETSPRIAWGDSRYLVVYADSCSNGGDILAVRVSAAGTVADPLGIVVSEAVENQDFPVVAWNGTNFLVVWQDHRSGNDYDIYGCRIGTDGTVLDPAGLAISAASDQQTVPSLTWTGTNFLVVWQDHRSGATDDIYGGRVDSTGAVLDPNGLSISTAASQQRNPAVDFDGSTSLVVWQDRRSGNYDIYGSRVDANGAVLDATGIPISTAAGTQSDPAIVFDGVNYLVAWGDSRSTFDSDVYGARVSPAGVVADASGILVSTSANGQMNPAVGWDGTNFFVVWEDYRLGNVSDLYGARVSTAGSILDTTGIVVSSATDEQLNPAVSWDGTNYLVVWQDFRSGNDFDIYGARVSGLGVVADPNGFAISTSGDEQTVPSVDWDGTNHLVVWQDHRSGSTDDVYGSRVSAAASVLDPGGIGISTAGSQQRQPAAAFDGSNHLVVWQDRRSGNYDVYGARVSPAGTVLDASGIPISTATDEQSLPGLASDGTNTLVVWRDRRSGTSFDIYGARVASSGTVLDPAGIPISTAAFDQTAPAVAWDGSNFASVWQDFRSGNNADLFLARVSAAGVVLTKDVAGLAVTSTPINSFSPSLVAGPSLRAAIAYNRLAEGPLFGSQRAMLRFEFECPSDGGGAKGPCLITPAHGSALALAAQPPTFTWGTGGTTVARVQFSASPTFAKPRLWSGAYKPGTAYTPTATQWSAIVALAAPGSPIYWRVIGKAGASSTKGYPSADTYSFTVGP